MLMNPAEAGILQRLVICPCGHALDSHAAAGGCRGDRRTGCRCALDPANALEAAVEHERTEAWSAMAAEPERFVPEVPLV